MGCDIHMYIEYRDKKSDNSFISFGGNISPGRNYLMFGYLAKGTRSDLDKGFEPKGLPSRDELGYNSKDDAYLYITKDGKDEDETTLENALKWEKYGNKIIYQNDKSVWVEHPDWHTHSWLSLEEYKQALENYKNHPSAIGYKEPKYDAVLAAMQSLNDSGHEVRIVFWFVN